MFGMVAFPLYRTHLKEFNTLYTTYKTLNKMLRHFPAKLNEFTFNNVKYVAFEIRPRIWCIAYVYIIRDEHNIEYSGSIKAAFS